MNKIIATVLLAASLATADVCQDIYTNEDEFTGEITQRNPFDFTSSLNPIAIYKHIRGGSAVYSLILSVKGSDNYSRLKNVDVKFFDGTVYSFKNAEVNARYSDGWNYSTMITLTREQFSIFKSKNIQKYRLSIYSREVGPEESATFKGFVNCL
jgi:hypothetical protein